MKVITSPNTVLANCLQDTLDIVQPRIQINKPKEVVFSVGTQINGFPHIGTYLVQASAFVLAQKVQAKFGIPTRVVFGALDNAPYKVVETQSGSYQIDWGHAEGHSGVMKLVTGSYIPYFEQLAQITGVPFEWSTYTAQQASPEFRQVFIDSLVHSDKIRWCVSPSNGILRMRIPCPQCHYAQKYADDTKLLGVSDGVAKFACLCHEHGRYEVDIDVEGNGYIDLNTVYRNVIKEAIFAKQSERLAVMVKGGDWLYSTQPVDWALAAMGFNSLQVPMRLFTPQILTGTGAKLSKSLIREGDTCMSEVPDWLLDMSKFRSMMSSNYANALVWLVEQFSADPRHFYRSYSYDEIVRLVNIFKEECHE